MDLIALFFWQNHRLNFREGTRYIDTSRSKNIFRRSRMINWLARRTISKVKRIIPRNIITRFIYVSLGISFYPAKHFSRRPSLDYSRYRSFGAITVNSLLLGASLFLRLLNPFARNAFRSYNPRRIERGAYKTFAKL